MDSLDFIHNAASVTKNVVAISLNLRTVKTKSPYGFSIAEQACLYDLIRFYVSDSKQLKQFH